MVLNPNFEAPGANHQALTGARRDLNDQQANDMNVGLALIFANQIGKLDRLSDAILLASRDR